MAIKVVAFDVFGTLVSLHGVPVEEVRAYGEHIMQYREHYEPLKLPGSWERLPAKRGIQTMLKSIPEEIITITLSNGPIGLITRICRNNDLTVDCVFPVGLSGCFKPAMSVYACAAREMGVQHDEFMMVTSNEHFGDIEAARSLGMRAHLLRDPESLLRELKGTP